VRIERAGVIGGAIYLVLSALWLVAARPPGNRILYEVWFIPLLLVGLSLPGPANQVTLARAYLALPSFVYALSPSTYGPLAVCVALAGATDLADGTLARRFGTTQLGGGLDPVVDGIYFGSVAVGLATGAAYPAWLAGVVVGRYALPALVGAVLFGLGRRPDLRHTLFGQLSTLLIACLLGLLALLRALGQDTLAVVAIASVVIPVSTLTTFGNLAWQARGALGSGDAPEG
jgi:phosphatidylglycerophosphate synthase